MKYKDLTIKEHTGVRMTGVQKQGTLQKFYKYHTKIYLYLQVSTRC